MKKITRFKRIFAVMLCFVMMLGIASVSVSAAKETFTTYQIDDVTITGIDAPTAGKKFDFTAEENSQKYNVIKVAWKSQYGSNYITSTSESATAGTKYTVYVVLEVATPNHYFNTDSSRRPAVSSVTVNGNTANANNAMDYSLFSVDASKYEHDTTYQKYLTVMYTFPTVEAAPIESVEFDVPALVPGERVPTTWQASGIGIDAINGNANNGQVNVSKVEWSLQDGTALAGNEVFEYGKKYTLTLTLGTAYGASFATDPNHFLSQPGKPFPTVTVKMNGKTATVLPTYDNYSNLYVVAACAFDCDTAAKIEKIDLTDIDAPATGNTPDYEATYTNVNYGAADYNNATTKNGISWYNETDKKTISTSDKFEAGKTYTVQVMIWTNDGYEFQYKSGSVNVAATVNGKSAEVISRNSEEVTLYYTFPKTEEHKCSPLKVAEVKATCKEAGKKAYYFCPECGKNFEDSKCTKEIADINAWGKIEKLEHTGGKATCGNRAICTRCGEYYGEIMQHQWSTTPNYTDSKGHAYKCTVCGEHDTVQAHTGGTADCQNKAVCTVCGTAYGKTGEHKWSTQWDFTDTRGHAHKCTVCGDHDSIVKHTPGAAATDTSSQNCTVCNYVIEPAKNHKHKLTKVAAVDADCTTAGKEQHYVCDGCGKIFSDSKGSKEITDKDSLVISAAGHKDSKWKSDADVHWKECTVKGCGAITVEKEAHEFNKAGKCTVCEYKSDEKTDSIQTTDTPDEQDTTISENPDATDNPGEDTTPTPDTTDVNAPETDGGNNTVMWIVVIACGIIAVASIVVVAVVHAKNKKK